MQYYKYMLADRVTMFDQRTDAWSVMKPVYVDITS